jgi:hypothetical protein
VADIDLAESFHQFDSELLLEAEFSGDPQHMCFFRIFSEIASENGDIVDLDYTPVRKEGRGGYQVDGYAIDLERGELFLAICDFHSDAEVQTLNSSGMETLFRRVDSFLENAIKTEFINALEETSPAFEAAYPIYNNRRKIKRIRIILLSNAVLAVRKKVVEAGEIIGTPAAYNVLDFTRYVDILASQGNAEPIEIDVAEINGEPLPCLQAHVHGSDYSSFLVVLPARFLADIYGLYGPRLLEQNVRVFLQARTKVNRGIIDTVREAPKMFFAYNNGLTATASEVEIEELPGGGLGISSAKNLQIVNGGQTTASILYAKDQYKSDLTDVFVQMKLSVIKPELVDEIVPKISRFANTQNRISEADFFSSHPFHLEMEKISRRLSAPPKPGSLAPTKWFYERARGQYKDKSAYGSRNEKRRFEAEYPKKQVVSKTDLAKYQATFECMPHLVSRGAQKCFLDFAEGVSKEWAKSQDGFNEGYFRTVMAKAIVFRETDRLVGVSDWYKADRGYKANIVTYAIAWLVNHLKVRSVQVSALDLQSIWNRQELPEDVANALLAIARHVSTAIRDTPENVRNVGEYAKQQQCWANISKLEITLPTNLESSTISISEVKQQEKDQAETGRIDREIDFERDLFALQSRIPDMRQFATSKRLLSPNSSRALDKVERLDLNITRPEKNALKYLFSQMKEKGYEFLVD